MELSIPLKSYLMEGILYFRFKEGDGRDEITGSRSKIIRAKQSNLYKRIDVSMHLLSEANGRGFEIPEYQRNLVLAKVSEIRERL